MVWRRGRGRVQCKEEALGWSKYRRGFLTSPSLHLTVTAVHNSGYPPASLSLSLWAPWPLGHQASRKKSYFFPVLFFLPDFPYQDHGRKKKPTPAIYICVYVLLTTCYKPGIVPDTREIMMNRSLCPLRAFILFSKKLLRCRINIPTSAKESLAAFSSVKSLSYVQLFATPWTVAHQASLSITNSWSLLILMSIESVMPSSHLILCRPLLLPPSPSKTFEKIEIKVTFLLLRRS